MGRKKQNSRAKPPPKKKNIDPDWNPTDEVIENVYEDQEGIIEAGEDLKRVHRVHLVEERQLLKLFEVCRYPGCGLLMNPEDLKIVNEGSYLRIEQNCACQSTRKKEEDKEKLYSWESNERAKKGGLCDIDLNILSEAKTNAIPTKQLVDFLNGMKIPSLSRSTMHELEQTFFYPAVIDTYLETQRELRHDLLEADEALKLGGDGRFDSPGFTAFYCFYPVYDTKSKKFIGFQLNSKKEIGVKGSAALEPLGAKLIIQEIKDDGLRVSVFTTDRSRSIKKMIIVMNGSDPENPIIHQYDIWHVVRSIMTKLRLIHSLKPWLTSISNFLWWAFANSGGNYVLLMEMLDSMVYHLCDIHTFEYNIEYTRCTHPVGYDPKDKVYQKPSSAGIKKINEILQSEDFREDLKSTLLFQHTGPLECLNNVANKFAPKSTYYGPRTMRAKMCMSIMHVNENSDREILSDGELPKMSLKSSRHGPKTLKLVRENVTTEWTKHVKRKFFLYYINDIKEVSQISNDEKRARKDRLERERAELLKHHQTRFAYHNQAKHAQEEREDDDLMDNEFEEEEEDNTLKDCLELMDIMKAELDNEDIDDISSESDISEFDYLEGDIETQFVKEEPEDDS